MSAPLVHRLGDLQLRILKTLWARGEATVAEVHADLGHAERFAYTTIATMLRKMEGRGLVAHRATGRTFVYHPCVAAEQVSRGMVEHVLDRVFAGSLADLVSHLLTAREVSHDELGRLEKLIAKRKRSR